MKRCISLLLVLAMVFSLIPVHGSATEIQQSTTVDAGNVSIEDTNGFGNLLSEAITREQEEMESEYEAGYTVTDLEITGNVATVTYDTLEEAILIVALYTEDGMRMVTSAKTTVTADATQATVTFGGAMPEYFLASAYLVDSFDYSPLCEAYDTPMYTREMQELLSSTVNDYDADRVLNLDEDETTNFAVYAHRTKVIEYVEGYNEVAYVDEETATYVIRNADEQVTSLSVGDIFAYPYGENQILIAKVETIKVRGNAVTITGAELEMDDVFSAVKITGEMDTEDAQFDAGNMDEGITYIGKVQGGNGTEAIVNGVPAVQPQGNEISRETAIGYEYKFTEPGKFEVEGKLEIKSKVHFDYYITQSYQRIEFAVDFSAEVGIQAKLSGYPVNKEAKIGSLTFPVVPGISIAFTPSFVLKLEVSAEGSLEFKNTVGAALTCTNNGWDIISLCTAPKASLKFELEGKIFAGFKLEAAARVLEGVLAEAEVEGQLGFEVTGKMVDVSTSDSADTRHDCAGCLDGKLAFNLKISPSFQCLKSEKLKFKTELVNLTVDLFSFYLCLEHMDGGIGQCPRVVHKITVTVRDENGKLLSNAKVAAGEYSGVTNAYGTAELWLPLGYYYVEAQPSAGVGLGTAYLFVDGPEKLAMVLYGSGNPEAGNGILDDAEVGSITESDYPIVSGTCGDHVTWRLYRGGILFISGTGPMTDYENKKEIPWYEYEEMIKHVVIDEGVTHIGNDAFIWHRYLRSVTIPDSVKTIGAHAFQNCADLVQLSIGSGVTHIGDHAFTTCSALPSITIPDGVKYIGDYALYACANLTHVTIPDSVTYLGDYALYWCTSLKSIKLSENIDFIGVYTLGYCSNLTTVKIPDSVTSIRDNAFFACTGLTDLEIPDQVTSIGKSAFSSCRNLTDMVIPDSVTSIGDSAFYSCESLVRLTLGDGVEVIDRFAFRDCGSLSSVTFPKSVKTIGDRAFAECTGLSTITFLCDAPVFEATFDYVTATAYYPADNPTWTADAIKYYGSCCEITWIPYTLDEDGDMILHEATVTAEVELLDVLPRETEAEQTGLEMNTRDFSEQDESLSPNAIFGGEYGTEVTDMYILKTASFTDLVPGAQYVLLAMKSIQVEDPLDADNLLYIDQGVALEDGTLVFTYAQRETVEASYVVACGASNQNLNDAEITFPEMTADGELQAVNPTVVYDGETLVEGRDYTIVGTVSFTEAGEYTCYIRGIRSYAGLVKCVYQVKSNTARILGDLNQDGAVDANDLTLLARHLAGIEQLTSQTLANADVNGDGEIDANDLTQHARYVAGIIKEWD